MFDLINDALSEFCDTIGLKKPDINDDQYLEISFENLGCIYFKDDNNGRLLIYNLLEFKDHHDTKKLNHIFRLCHYNKSGIYDIKCCLPDQEQLILKIVINQENISSQIIENILQHIYNIHNKIIL